MGREDRQPVCKRSSSGLAVRFSKNHLFTKSSQNAMHLNWGHLDGNTYWLVIHHSKSTNSGYLEVKGFLIWSTYSWEKGDITIVSNFWTPCRFLNIPGRNMRSNLIFRVAIYSQISKLADLWKPWQWEYLRNIKN